MGDREMARIVARLHAQAWRESYRGLYSDEFLDRVAPAERLDYWRRRIPQLRAGNAEIFLATVGNHAAGFACIEIDGHRQRGAFVQCLYVLRRFQRHGLGRLLLDAALDWARSLGEVEARLHVLESNLAARGFYACVGWRVEARRSFLLTRGGRSLHTSVPSSRAPVLQLVKST